jgi:1,4-dihydroxy-2-naphthoate octaprenyltransferase
MESKRMAAIRAGSLMAWFLELRPHFLVLSLALVFLGSALAWHDGHFQAGHAALGGLGLLLLHICVNTLNDYFDYQSGIDLKTVPTPFSGGSRVLIAGLLSPGSVLRFALACFVLAVPIGAYFLFRTGWGLLPILTAGALIVLLYTQFLTRLGIGEIAAGLGLGTLPILGLYYVQAGTYPVPVLWASIIPGLLTFNLLFLNEFPDLEADRAGGRRHLLVLLGRSRCAWLYAVTTHLVYAWIILGVVLKLMPPLSLLGLSTLPQAVRAVRGSFNYREDGGFLPVLAANVAVVIGTPLLMAIGYILTGRMP